MSDTPAFSSLIDAADPARFGAKAARLARMLRAQMPTPKGLVLDFDAAARIAAQGEAAFDGPVGAALEAGLADLEARSGKRLDGAAPLILSLRASAGPGASGAAALLNIGVTRKAAQALGAELGEQAAADLRRRMIHDVAIAALEVDPEFLEGRLDEGEPALLRAVAGETGVAFPEDPRAQLKLALLAMARAWARPRARLMRQARGEDPEAGLAFIIEEMALGLGAGVSGAGWMETRDAEGAPALLGGWLAQAQGEEAALGLRPPAPLSGPNSLEAQAPEVYRELARLAREAELVLGDALRLEFTLEQGRPLLLDAIPMPRAGRAALRVAVELAEAGAISRTDALLRVDPKMLVDHLHPSIDPAAARDLLARGLPASPGAASGPIAFTAAEAEAAAARGEPAILVRQETKPEDIRGMHVAAGVLTIRGGMTSHAAVVARGLGVPCVAGASELALDVAQGLLRARDGRVFERGASITVDGGAGEALAGAAAMVQPKITGAFATLMAWADAERRMRVRANADTPADARLARGFNVDGIGLCRTEHMFFDKDRITVMREMILAETSEVRRAALDRLLPWQRADFVELFSIMKGLPVTIRLLDPPLHEFLPHDAEELEDLAAATGLSPDRIRARAAELAEFNPMLGLRGCRLGVTVPEIYEMQARAIVEAAIEAGLATGAPAQPEVMIPLVSAKREMDVLRARVEEVAEEVLAERDADLPVRIGCMVETPRAALRAGDIARGSDFLSFGTNDLTQMTYGLSRDDAGRFMGTYLAQEVLPADPFQTLDVEGVGELLLTAAERARRADAAIALGLCGEHGGDPASIRFCELAGFDYVSCSPYRAPIARLAAAQASILSARGET